MIEPSERVPERRHTETFPGDDDLVPPQASSGVSDENSDRLRSLASAKVRLQGFTQGRLQSIIDAAEIGNQCAEFDSE
jgi:hypothetical protein